MLGCFHSAGRSSLWSHDILLLVVKSLSSVFLSVFVGKFGLAD